MSPHDGPFHAIYIIDSNSGLTLLAQNYSNRSFDDDLMSGMLKALESFISHLAYADEYERIQEINFLGSRIIYERKGPIMAVGISKKTDEQQEHAMLNRILTEFQDRFSYYFNGFVGNIKPFQDFKPRLEELGQNVDNIQSLQHVQQNAMNNKPSNFLDGQTEVQPNQPISGPRFPIFRGFQQIE